jgi:hypothetical protein
MGMFDDLLPSTGGGSAFADLIPSSGGSFDDLVPSKPTPVKPEVDLTKPAFAAPRQRATELQKVQAAAVEERAKPEAPKFEYKELYTNPDLFKIVQDYNKVATGKEYKEGEDKEQYVAGFMSNLRGQEWNTFSNIAALNKLKNSPMPDREKLALGNRLFDQVKDATEKGGQPGAAPFVDIAKSALTDLTNYIGFGVATGLKKVAAKEATKAATASLLKATPTAITAATMGTEAVVGAGQNVAEQKKKQAVSTALGETPEDLDATQIGVAALIGSVGGFFEAKGAMAVPAGKTGAEQLTNILKKKQASPKDPNAPVTSTERILVDPVTENMDKVVEDFIKIEGRRILDEVNPATALTDAKIQKDMSARAVRVAMHVIDQDPTFRLKPNQQVSSAINEVFSNLDNVNDAVLEQAIRKEGLTPDDFAKANKMTVSEAAQVMQQYSAASKVLKRMTEIDPEFKKQVDALFEKPDSQVSALGRVGQAVQTLERESKAWVVSGIGTTVRNIIGTSVGLTYNSAASLVEGAMYTVGRTLDGAAKGQRLTTAMRSLGDTMSDAFNVYGYMAKGGLSTEVTDTLLQHNPALRNNILSATQESSTNEISRAARIFNSLNVAQDAFFRKAIFNASVEKHMRRAGLDMYETIGAGKTIPASILQQATDETLKATFSYTPKVQKKGIQTFEAGAEAAGNLFVKAAEFPGGSLIATFPRFMSNAIAFQYRYSVFGAMSGAEDLAQGALLKAAGSSGGEALIRKGQENIAKGVVGTAALAAAYDYRLNNQDTEWYNMKNDDGSTVDTRAIFPLGPTLAVADFMAKRKMGLEPKTAEAAEAIIGMKMPAGTQNQFLDQVFAAFSSEKEADKIEVAVGKAIGDFTARFSQPFVFKSAYEFFDLFREEGAIQRDPNVIKSEGTGDRILEAATNRVQSKLPVVKESLPEAVPRLREGPVYKEGEFFYSLIGVRETPKKTPAEQEITRLGIDPYKLYGPSSGDREYDRTFVEFANPMVIKAIERTTANERYQALSPTEQKLALTNVVRDVTGIARDKTDGKFMSEDIVRVKKMQFDKLSQDQRKVINERYAKDNNGVTLEEAKDYKAVDKYNAMLGNLAFAAGGLVPAFATGGFAAKAIGKKIAGQAAESVLDTAKKLKAAAPVEDTAIDDIISKRLSEPTTSPAIDQTANMLMGKKPVLPKAASKSKPVLPEEAAKPPEAPVLSQTEEALPTLPTQTIEAPTPSKAFADEDYIMGEEAMLELYTPAQLKSWKVSDPEDYANTLHNFTGTAKGLKSSEIPPQPFAKKVDESLVDDIEYDIDGNEISVNGVSVTPSKGADSMLDEELASFEADVVTEFLGKKTNGFDSGNLNFKIPELDMDEATMSQQKNYVKQRNDLLDSIRQYRTKEFSNIRKDESFDMFDDEVLGVLQGEFRAKFNREFNVASDKDVGMKLASSYQNKLDSLREQYKDVPDKKLWHGNTAAKIAPVKAKGFTSPQQSPKYHEELMVGAPSFTSDLNLNAKADSFGGTTPENILYTKMPYADYVFTRINMQPGAYDTKDLNIIARSINGSSTVVRPISLPRAGYFEKEDMMVEADKLRLSSGGKDMKSLIAPSNRDASPEMYNETAKRFNATLKNAVKTKSVTDAYTAYGGVRDLMSVINNMASNVSVKGGRGHQAATKLNSFFDKADKLSKIDELNKVADILDTAGAKQKAQTLRSFTKTLSNYGSNFGGDAVEEAGRIKELNAVFNAAEKLAKGGLAIRR